MIELRRAYHKALLEFLSEPSEINPVTAAYLWSEGSWDPMGILSSMFVDPEIQKLVREHNAKKESN